MDFYRRMAEQCRTGTFRKTPDYLVIQHMEPDHSASIPAFLKNIPKPQWYPQLRDFSSWNSFPGVFAGQGLPAEQRIVAANDGVLELGQHSLHLSMLPWCIGRRL